MFGGIEQERNDHAAEITGNCAGIHKATKLQQQRPCGMSNWKGCFIQDDMLAHKFLKEAN